MADPLRAGAVIADRFTIESARGVTGGMGTVYRGHDALTDRAVAVKILPSHDLRVAREINALAELDHACVVRLVAHGRDEDHNAYLVMDWIDGEDLGARLERGPLTITETCHVLERVAAGLAVAHARGIVHRDIKPRNIMFVDNDPRAAVIIDFGIARHDEDTAVTMGTILGTPRYMAPEQASGRRAGPRADVYSLGCVLFECLTGQTPFTGPDAMAIMAAKVMANPPRLRDFLRSAPLALDALLDQLLAKNPTGRPADGGALAALVPALWRAIEETARDETIAVTRQEARVTTVLLARGAEPITLDPLAGRSFALPDGTIAVALDEPEVLVDRVALAARTGALLARKHPALSIAIATGTLATTPVGCEVIQRALALLDRGAGRVWLDTVSADLLARTYEITSDEGGSWLGVEHGGVGAIVLGRVAPFVGRERELRSLRNAIDDGFGERAASAVIVTGDAGLGKSRLVHEAVRRIEVEIDLWTVRADPMAAGAPYALLVALLRKIAGRRNLPRVLSAVLPPDRVGPVAKVLEAQMVDAIAEDDPTLQSVQRAGGTAMVELVKRAWEEWTGALLERRPLVLVLDDLHLADATSLAIVDALLRGHRGKPLVVLATARPELANIHPRLWDTRGVQTIALAPLAERAAEAFVDEVLPGLAPERRAQVIEHAQGSPFLLEELVRAAANTTDKHAPVAAVAIVQARLDKLAPELRRVLRAASVFGRDFTRAGVAEVLAPATDEEVAAGLTALATAEVIDLAGTDATFRHDLVRDAAYASLPERDRLLAHRRAATWLAEHAEVPAAIAGHFEEAGMPGEATQWWVRAAEHASRANDVSATLRFAAQAEPHVRGEVLGRLEELRGHAFRWSGALDEAERSAGVAQRHLREGEELWFSATATQIAMRCVLGKHDGTDELIERLCLVARERATDAAALAIGRTLAQLMLNDSAFDRTWSAALESTLAQVLALGDARRSDDLEIVLADIAGEHALEIADHATALRLGRDIQAREERRANHVAALQQLSINGYYLYELGRHEEARAALEAVNAEARERELARLEAHSHHNLGVVLAELGETDAALSHETRAFAYYVAQQDHRMIAGCRMYLGHIMCKAGRFEDAETEARHALDAVADSKYAPFAWAILARALLGQDRAVEAMAAIEEATAGQRVAEGWAWVSVVDAEIALVFGDRLRAGRLVTDALRELDRRCAKLEIDDDRTIYRTGVEAHRRLLALADELAR